MEELLLDQVMLSLRQSDGLDLLQISNEFGEGIASTIRQSVEQHVRAGTVVQSGHKVSLKDPEGFLLSNGIISDIFVALDRS